MKLQTTKKLLAFIISIMVFSGLPKFTTAQKHCPSGKILVCDASGTHCKCETEPSPPPPCRGCGIASVDSRSFNINLPTESTRLFSIKMFDLTGRLIKIFGNRSIEEGDHQIHWNMKDDEGSAVATGIYILRFDRVHNSETEKISLVN